jgi:hypothetical protein
MLRRAFAAFWFALLLFGQQAAALHAVAHAAECLAHREDSTPAQVACDQCLLGAQLSSALGTAIPQLPDVDAYSTPDPLVWQQPAPAQAPVHFRSRAPPAAL